MDFKRLIFISFLVALLLAVTTGYGQQGTVLVKDGKTKQPVPFAHVAFKSLQTKALSNSITDEKGEAPNKANDRSVVSVSYVGYQTINDTIFPGQSLTLFLEPKIQEINEVVVTAQYAPRRVDQSIYKVKVINSRQIEQKAATNLTELLNSDLNIRINQDGALGSSLSMQGLSGENVKFLIDGVPVIGRMNGNIDISQLNLYNVDHIEIIEGPMSVVYGSNALAGVINIITRENTNSLFTAQANGYVESVGVFNFDGGVSVRRKDHTFSLTGGRNFFNGYNDSDTSRSVRWKPKRQYFFDGYYLYSRPKYKAKISSSFFNEKLLNKGDLMPPYYETAFDSYFLTTRSTTKVEMSSKLKADRFLSFIGAYSIYKREKQTYYKDLTTLDEYRTKNAADQDTTFFYDIMARATFSKSRDESKLNYQMGIDINTETGTGKRITDERQQIGDYAAFLSLEYTPWKSLMLQPGVRAIYNTKYNAPLVYSLNVKWDFLEHYFIRASYSRGFRAPSLKELYLYFVDVNHNIRGNEDLEAENSHNVNMSLQYSRETSKNFASAEINLFYNNINNIITLAQAGGDLYTYINVDKYITQGIQAQANVRIYPQLSVRFGGGLTGRYNSLSEDTTGVKDFYYSPDAVATFNYRWMKPDLDFTLDYKFTGRLPQFFVDENNNVAEGYISSYNTMDFTVRKSFFRDYLNLSAGVKNIFNNTTIPAVGGTGGVHSGGTGDYPIGWGRTFFIKATFNFRKY